MIQFHRFMFWMFFVSLILCIPLAIISFIFGKKTDDYNEEDKILFYGITIFLVLLFVLAIFKIDNSYNKGYSEEAIKKKAELTDQLNSYTMIISVLTGQFRLEMKQMVETEVAKALCEAIPNTPCDEVIRSYEAYQELIGWKDSADNLAKILSIENGK